MRRLIVPALIPAVLVLAVAAEGYFRAHIPSWLRFGLATGALMMLGPLGWLTIVGASIAAASAITMTIVSRATMRTSV